ncbi:MAG: hypothetical protein VB131_08025, partial [Burkholderia gladioli]
KFGTPPGGPVKDIDGRGALRASNGGGTGQTSVMLAREGAPKDARQWEVLHGGDGSVVLRIVNDAYSDARSAFEMTRKTKPADQPGGERQTLFDLSVMRLMPSGGVVAVGGDADPNGDRLQMRGSGQFDGDVTIRNGEAQMNLRLGPIDGFWHGNKETWGFWSPKSGALQYVVADKALRVDGHTVWHEGNLTPLDVNNGGVINGDVAFAKRPTWAGVLVPFDTGNFDPSTKVNRSGDTMTGPLTLASGTDYSPLILSAKGYTPRIQADNSSSSILVANSANNAVNLWIYDGGQVSTRSNLTVGGTTYAGGSNATIAPDGNIWGSQWGGWLRGFLDNTLAHKSGDTFAGRVTLSANAWQADLCLSNRRPGQNVSTYLRARDGGGLEIINNAYNGVPWSISDAGETWQQNALHVGPVTLQTDDNLCIFRFEIVG